MQPRKLTMKNFGPFINETLDFGDFQEAGLFLVSGKTGAGKTTIFDGMTYALFGETSGNLRSGKEMRSMFASPKEETCVTFSFEHQGILYEIERRPEQTLMKKRGEGTKDQAAKVALTIFDEDLKEIRRFSKKTEVEQYIKELLHLDAKQFLQIIMLPQGEFRNFLVASSNDKEKVLRNLFGTEIYQRLNEWLKEQSKNQQQRIQQQLITADTLKSRFHWTEEPAETVTLSETLTQWQEALRIERQKSAELQAKLLKAQDAQKTAEQRFYQAQALAELFDEKSVLETKQAELSAQLDQIALKKNQLLRLQWSKEQQGLLSQLDANQTKHGELEERLTKTRASKAENQQELEGWRQKRPEIQQQQIELKQKNTELQEKNYRLPLVREKEKLMRQQKDWLAQKDQFDRQEAELTVKKEQVSLEKQTAQKTIAKKDDWQKQEVLLLKAQQLAEQWQMYQSEERETKEKILYLQQQITEIDTKGRSIEQEIPLQERLVAQLKSKNAQMQIARLSLDLLEGEPCPLCGATSHPNIAQHQQYSLTEIKENEQQLETAEQLLLIQKEQSAIWKQKTEQLQTTLEETLQKQAQIQHQQKQANQDFWGLFTLDQEKTQKKDLQEYLKAALADQQAQEKAFQEAQECLSAIEKQQMEINEEAAALQTAHHNLDAQLQQAAGKITTLTAQVGEIAESQLQAEIAQLQAEIQQAETMLSADGQLGETLKTQQAALEEQVSQILEQVTHCQKEHQTLQEKLQQAFDEADFSADMDTLRNWLTELPLITGLTEEINEYEQKQAVIQHRLQELTEKIGTQQAPDLLPLSENYEQAQQLVNESQEYFFEQKERVAQNEKLYDTLKELYEKNRAETEEQMQLQQLFRTINGDNEYKTSLERYVLQAYLAEILEIANQRLLRLTRGRYQFELADTISGNKKNTGLEINIYDDNAGASRRAHTLSGGESFIAALALALSLADVIQNRSGGIAIEALFIDEGFGSLDEESLEMAMEALAMIENEGRLIGIISHVRELKERVTQQVLVKTNGSGQSKIAYRL